MLEVSTRFGVLQLKCLSLRVLSVVAVALLCVCVLLGFRLHLNTIPEPLGSHERPDSVPEIGGQYDVLYALPIDPAQRAPRSVGDGLYHCRLVLDGDVTNSDGRDADRDTDTPKQHPQQQQQQQQRPHQPGQEQHDSPSLLQHIALQGQTTTSADSSAADTTGLPTTSSPVNPTTTSTTTTSSSSTTTSSSSLPSSSGLGEDPVVAAGFNASTVIGTLDLTNPELSRLHLVTPPSSLAARAAQSLLPSPSISASASVSTSHSARGGLDPLAAEPALARMPAGLEAAAAAGDQYQLDRSGRLLRYDAGCRAHVLDPRSAPLLAQALLYFANATLLDRTSLHEVWASSAVPASPDQVLFHFLYWVEVVRVDKLQALGALTRISFFATQLEQGLGASKLPQPPPPGLDAVLAANGLASDGQPLPTSSGAEPVPGKSKSSQSSDPVHLYSLCLRERSLDSPDPVASTKCLIGPDGAISSLHFGGKSVNIDHAWT